MKKKKRKVKSETEVMLRDYRKLNDSINTFYDILLNKEYKNNKQYFTISLLSEAFIVLKMIAFSFICEDSVPELTLINYRKMIEILAISETSTRMDDTNYQLFKIQAEQRDIGERELTKLSKKLNFKPNIFRRIVNLNRCFYLIGATENHEKFREVVACNTDANLLSIYDVLGIGIHLAPSSHCLTAIKKILENKAFSSCFDSFLEVSNKIMAANKKIITPIPKIDEDFLLDFGEIGLRFSMLSEHFEDLKDYCFDNSEVDNQYLIETASFCISSLKSLIYSYYKNEYFGVIPLLKVSYEKVSLYNELLKLSPEDASIRFNTLYSIIMRTFMDVLDSGSDSLSNEVFGVDYNYFKEKAHLTMSETKRIINKSPIFAVTLKHESFIELVKRNIEEIDKENIEGHLDAYLKGVEYSHATGFLIHRNKEEFKGNILFGIKYLMIFLLNAFKSFEKVERTMEIEGDVKSKIITMLSQCSSDLRILFKSFISLYNSDFERYLKVVKKNESNIEELEHEISDDLN